MFDRRSNASRAVSPRRCLAVPQSSQLDTPADPHAGRRRSKTAGSGTNHAPPSSQWVTAFCPAKAAVRRSARYPTRQFIPTWPPAPHRSGHRRPRQSHWGWLTLLGPEHGDWPIRLDRRRTLVSSCTDRPRVPLIPNRPFQRSPDQATISFTIGQLPIRSATGRSVDAYP